MNVLPEFEVSPELIRAQLEASAAYADAAAEPSRVVFYDASEQQLVSMPLTKPCGQITPEGYLQLTQASGTGDMIVASGQAVTARWLRGDGKLVARGNVTAEGDGGHFELQGSEGTQLYAGGRVLLGVTRIY